MTTIHSTTKAALRAHLAAALDGAIAESGCSNSEAALRAGMHPETLRRKRSGASTLYVHDLFALASAGIISPDAVPAAGNLSGNGA